MMTTRTAIAALLIATMGVTGVATAAYAAPAAPMASDDNGRIDGRMNGPDRFDRQNMRQDMRKDMRHDRQAMRAERPAGMRAGAGFPMLVCAPNAAERMEVGLVRLQYRLTDLTDEQKTLYDTFKTTALTTQTKLSDACAAALPAQQADAKPDPVERMKTGIAVQTARLDAMNAVLPDFEAFYNSLTDTQKAALHPKDGGGRHGGWGHGQHGGPDDKDA